VQLRPDVDAQQVTAVLLELAQEVENVRAYGSGGSPQQQEIFANKYLAWVDIAEAKQRNWWMDGSWLNDLHTTRWQSLSTGKASASLVNGEIDFQAHRLRNLAEAVHAVASEEPKRFVAEPAGRRNDGIGHVTDSKDTRSVFVVHGRNEDLRRAMFEFLRSVNLAPMEWTHAVELTGVGSPYIGQVLDAAFDNARAVVVLLTPDEIAYLQPRYGNGDQDAETLPAPQARPNVLFEAGMALGRDASRTVLVAVGEVRPFSDVAGRHAVRLNNGVSSRQALAQRLRTAGCDVDLTGTDWHTAGDFTPPPPPGDGLALGRRIPTGARTRPPVDFDVKYLNKGGNRIDKLQVINRGTEAAYDVTLTVPDNAALDLQRTQSIERIPGGGKSVTVDVMNYNRFMGGGVDRSDAFDITVAARTDSGENVSQDIFIDLNG
jgi:predicted nucleotide-binding protein